MALFEIPEAPTRNNTDKANNLKLKKGETILTLIETAQQIVNEKLGKYKDASKCVTDPQELRKFFQETPEGAIIRNRY